MSALVLKIFMFSFLLLSPRSVSDYEGPRFHLWNVGQGLWATVSLDTACLHFDAGGEINPISIVRKYCRDKRQILFISHSDWDHIRFIPHIRRLDRNMCIYALPKETLKQTAQKILTDIRKCSKSELTALPGIEIQELVGQFKLEKIKKIDSNTLSRVFLVKSAKRHLLLTGDSTTTAENLWAQEVHKPIDIFLIGHHGSRTSTGEGLMQHLRELRKDQNLAGVAHMAVSSQRRKKYGHTHPLVKRRLQRFQTPLLETEKWGHLQFEL